MFESSVSSSFSMNDVWWTIKLRQSLHTFCEAVKVGAQT